MADCYASIVNNRINSVYYLYILNFSICRYHTLWFKIDTFREFRTFKNYVQEMGFAVEEVAKESCVETTALKSELTMEEAESIEKPL